MEVLWAKGSGTVADVVEGLTGRVSLAYSTVLTTLRLLETKGYLEHVKDGRAFVYRPVVGREAARDSAISHLVGRFFGGRPELLMLNLVEHGKTSTELLAKLHARIAREGDEL